MLEHNFKLNIHEGIYIRKEKICAPNKNMHLVFSSMKYYSQQTQKHTYTRTHKHLKFNILCKFHVNYTFYLVSITNNPH